MGIGQPQPSPKGLGIHHIFCSVDASGRSLVDMSTRRSQCIAKELGAAKLGDARRSARLERIAEAVMERPGTSLPVAMGSDAALEAAYRFLNNDDIEARAILAPHIAATADRVAAGGVAYCISDTTELRFGGAERGGMGPLQGGGSGFLAHLGLAVAADGSRLPLGILGVETIVRPPKRKGRRGTKKSRRAPDSESQKWIRVATAAEEAVGGRAQLVHLMDREADIYGLLASLVERGSRFVVRVAQNRNAEDEDGVGKLFELLDGGREVVTRNVPLSRRLRATKQHPKRSERRADLTLSSQTLTLHRPASARRTLPPVLTLNFVHAFEKHPPDGEKSVEWKLVTTEPCSNPKQVEAVIDAYRTRWVIEELNKALKTGCGIQNSQLECFDSIFNLLAISLPVAVQLLALRTLAAEQKHSLAIAALSPTQLMVLRAMAKNVSLPKEPTAEQALLAIASLGGHIRRNGPPGWIVLGRGFQDLVRYVEAWDVMKNMREM